MNGTWQDKHIDEWTCNELQEWISTLKLGYGNELKLKSSIAEQDIVGEDFNSIQEAKDIQDQFPGINIDIANKLYFALLVVNKNPVVNSLDLRANRRSEIMPSTSNQQSVPYGTFNQTSQPIERKERKEEYVIVENKYDDIAPNKLKRYYENLIAQLKQQQSNELMRRDNNAIQELSRLKNDIQRRKDKYKTLISSNATLKDQYEKLLRDKDKILEKQGRDIMEMNYVKQQQAVEITKKHEKIIKLNNEKLEINNKYLIANRENKQIKKEVENARKNRNESEENIKMVLKQMETLKTEKHKLLKQAQSIEHNNDKLKKQIVEYKKWKDKYLDKNKEFIILRNEKLNVENKQNELIERVKELTHKVNKYESEIKQYQKVKLDDINVDFIAAPCDILHDEDESDDEKKEEEDNVLLSDDELCKILQQDLENYIVDQRKKNMLILNELRIFHENKAQTVRNWDSSLKKNHFSTLFETLEEKVDDKYADIDDDDIDSEKIVYNILFDLIIESYDVLHSEYTKIMQKEYLSANVIGMVLMNISVFYDLMKREKIKTLKKRIANIHKYINDIINGIYNQTKSKHMYVDEADKNELCQFIVNCCELIWSVLHYDFTVYPLNFILSKSDRKYNDKIHKKEGVYEGDNIEYCIFPAIMKENIKHLTKIWVICDE